MALTPATSEKETVFLTFNLTAGGRFIAPMHAETSVFCALDGALLALELVMPDVGHESLQLAKGTLS